MKHFIIWYDLIGIECFDIYIYRSLEDCETIPIKMLQKIYWQTFRSTNDLPQCLSKLDWVCKD
jgi:hypothetical protein